MDSNTAQELFKRFAGAIAYVAVEGQDGVQGIGSAFHVGEGVFVTARHVVENLKILEVRITESLRLSAGEASQNQPKTPNITNLYVQEKPIKIAVGPLFYQNSTIDVAVFKADNVHPMVPYVPLGGHLDDWINDNDFILSEAVILGYPPIPLTSSPRLVAARAEVNAVIDPYHSKKVHFVLSAIPRGGFSGGIALSEYGFVLGIITEALCFEGKSPETSFFAVLSTEGVFECLAYHKLLHECQEEGWDDFWNLSSTDLVRPGVGRYTVHKGDDTYHIVASVREFDNGRRFYVEVLTDEVDILNVALATISATLEKTTCEREQVRESWVRFLIKTDDRGTASSVVQKAAKAAVNVLAMSGLGIRTDKS